ncbi:TIGR04086 family membrane protein [Neobacillus sp. OS1-32]|jgi:putative membrane protein (TIGR04086 family)|uniref:TIGR04086 family membrane protein n=1 Tax=Neobacillus paridis TaxID=2803862 RepID=A0ABS1TL56_9BACI|nr:MULTISPECIES: TIGR04086 family membrane protein [Neobacillus]MBL4951268.1 TIGR04086 family membrane protein [Neobacillus paridis]WML30586.1 TIGR04086 family membrane protein [Neobacillus sp. OS1-32]
MAKGLKGERKIESKSFGTAVLYGLIFIFAFAAICSLIMSFIMRFTSADEATLQYIVTAISFIALFGGGFLSGGKRKEKGWLIGGVTGLIYSIIVFLFQYLGYDRLFDAEQLIYHTCYTLIAMMGGILGVNVATNNSRSA